MGISGTSQSTPESCESAWRFLVAALKQRGHRVTEPRRIVLEHVCRREGHFSAESLVETLSQGPHRVSRGTVYRTLKLLAQLGVIREFHDIHRHAHYEWVWQAEPHVHIICESCGRAIEVRDEPLTRRIETLVRQYDFQLGHYTLLVYGRCGDCGLGERD